MRKRCIVYIDGFNLYYGAVKGTRHKWLDIQRLFERIRPDDDVLEVKYFTSTISGPRQANQLRYLQALSTLSKVSIIYGRFQRKVKGCRVSNCTLAGPREYSDWEEKRADVNIAVTLLDDAYRDAADVYVIVSGDADLAPAVRRVKARFPHVRLVVYVPAGARERGAATELRGAADMDRTLPSAAIQRSQLPPVIDLSDGSGQRIAKPESW